MLEAHDFVVWGKSIAGPCHLGRKMLSRDQESGREPIHRLFDFQIRGEPRSIERIVKSAMSISPARVCRSQVAVITGKERTTIRGRPLPPTPGQTYAIHRPAHNGAWQEAVNPRGYFFGKIAEPA
jgi:hypothetical protein